MGSYNPQVHGKQRLGYCPVIPVVPDVPTGAQLAVNRPVMHLKMPGGGYVVTPGIGVLPPPVVKTLSQLLQTGHAPLENSYSGSSARYLRLDVTDQDGDVTLSVAGIVVCKVRVDATVQIISADEPSDSDGEDEIQDIEGGQA